MNISPSNDKPQEGPPAQQTSGKPLARTNDGLTEEFRKDLENYLAETFCSILPKTE